MADLDRVIQLTIDLGADRNEFGEVVANEREVSVWAARRDVGANRLLETHGARGSVRRTYTVRWRQDLIDAIEAGRTVTLVEPGHSLQSATIVTITEPEGTRRRWLDLTLEGST